MRLFIAFNVNYIAKELQQVQQTIVSNLAKISYPRTFHCTLKFLGEVSEDKIDEIQKLMPTLEFKSFSVTLTNIGGFPHLDNPRVLWIGLEPREVITELQQKVDEALLGLFDPDARFHPHITIGRVKWIKNKSTLKANILRIKPINKKVFVDKIELIKSDLTPEGPQYMTIFEKKGSNL